MAKVVQSDGSKAIKVGTTIAVLAEQGDDLGSLEMPAPESAPAPPEAPKASSEAPKESESAPSSSKDSASKPSPSSGTTSARPQHQKYPLYPSVVQLFHENGLENSEADKIPASGPHGRLLKGDVLAHLGAIDASYPGQQADRLARLGHLDLSNIKIAPRREPEAASKADGAQPAPAPAEEPADVDVAIPISFEAVAAAQRRIRRALGIDVPIETFVARAIGLANADLPPPRLPPTADELFEQVLGLDAARPATSRGSFLPDIAPVTSAPAPPPGPAPQPDVYDILTGAALRRRPSRSVAPALMEADEATNTFSVRTAKGDEQRARVFLERMKTALQVEPGNLIL